MEFGLSKELSKDVYSKGRVVSDLSNHLKEYFKGKTYGSGVGRFIIGIICVEPKFDHVFNVRCNYDVSNKLFEIDVKLNHQWFRSADAEDIKRMILIEIRNSINSIGDAIPNFDLDKFLEDIQMLIDSSQSE